jgi:hypothetical protein
MPVSFDFFNGTSGTIANSTNPGPKILFDVDSVGGTLRVLFTVSTDADGLNEFVALGANSGGDALNLRLADQGGGSAGLDVWTLSFVDTASPANTQLTGTSGSRVEFFVRSMLGSMRYSYLTTGGTAGGVVVGGTVNGASTVVAPSALDGVGITGIRFTSLNAAFSDSITITSLSARSLSCFVAGTRIATPDGNTTVEKLAAGDTVMTADGRSVQVKWLGRQFVDTRTTHPAQINPICITAGALAENVPERDLFLSPDHAVEMDGYLVNAGALVNGESIYQVRNMPLEGFTYYHIETEAHELLVAEGCPAESFLDYSDTFGFDNADERDDRVIREMSLPRIASQRLLPAGIRNRMVSREAQAAA